MKRRHLLGALGLSALGVGIFGGLALRGPGGQTGELLRSRAPLPRPYTVPLPVPPVARPVRTDATTDFYEIVQREADQEILPGLRTRISRRGGGPGPHDAGWKDTVDLTPSDSVDVAVRFSDYTGRYLLHCHNLEHEDMAMMAAFRTT